MDETVPYDPNEETKNQKDSSDETSSFSYNPKASLSKRKTLNLNLGKIHHLARNKALSKNSSLKVTKAQETNSLKASGYLQFNKRSNLKVTNSLICSNK